MSTNIRNAVFTGGPINIIGSCTISYCKFDNCQVVIKGAAFILNNSFQKSGISTEEEEVSLFDWIIKNIRELREKEINDIMSKK